MKWMWWFVITIMMVIGVEGHGRAHAGDYLTPCLAPIENGLEPVEELASSTTVFICDGRQAALGAGDFLARLDPPAAVISSAGPLVLRIASVWQQSAQILFVYADGSQSRLAYSSADTAKYLTIGALPQFAIPQHDSPLAAIYIATHGSGNLRGVVMGAQVLASEESNRQQKLLFVLYSTFFGLSLSLLGYNFAMWIGLRQQFQISYCLMVAALLVHVFSSSGSVMLVFDWVDNNDRLRLNYVVQSLAVTAGISFIFRFFTIEVIGQRLNRLRMVFSGGMIAGAMGVALLGPWMLWLWDRLFFASGIAIIALLVPAMMQAWRAGSRFFWLIMVAWIAPVAAGLARAMHGIGLIPFSFWLDNANTLALSVEALISIPIIVARMRVLLDERDGALAAHRSAVELASSDPLTGLLNRRGFLERAIGQDGAYRLLLIDIDHFKVVNDRHGHGVGDDVLREVADVMQTLSYADCFLVRLGGEEFAILLPLHHAERLTPTAVLHMIRSRTMPSGLRVTASIGFGDGGVANESQWLELYKRADRALYRAKNEGRDRACEAENFTKSLAA